MLAIFGFSNIEIKLKNFEAFKVIPEDWTIVIDNPLNLTETNVQTFLKLMSNSKELDKLPSMQAAPDYRKLFTTLSQFIKKIQNAS